MRSLVLYIYRYNEEWLAYVFNDVPEDYPVKAVTLAQNPFDKPHVIWPAFTGEGDFNRFATTMIGFTLIDKGSPS